jgi:hypothetical protein
MRFVSEIRKHPVSRELANAEREFAGLISGFVSGFRPDQQPFVMRVCRSWCSAWLEHPLVLPTAGEAVRLAEEQIYHEHAAQRRRLQYQRRKGVIQ